MKDNLSSCLRLLLVSCLSFCTQPTIAQNETDSADSGFKVGLAQSVITPPIGYSINGNFQDTKASHVHDDTHSKAIVMSAGDKKLAIVVSDVCMLDRNTIDLAKEKAHKHTGIPIENMMMSATHTHSGGTACSVFQSDPEPEYLRFLVDRIADAVIRANNTIQPAFVGIGKGNEPTQVHNRRWHLKGNADLSNPFGGVDKVKMNPGVKSPNLKEPAGPTDPDLYILSFKDLNGNHIGMLANYSLHYVGGVGDGHVSADYFGMFGTKMNDRLNGGKANNKFIAIMSNGTSGDINNIDWKNGSWTPPGQYNQMDRVATVLADEAKKTIEKIKYLRYITLDATEKEIELGIRKASSTELKRANTILAKHKEEVLTNREAIYAREAVLLDKYPDKASLKLQAFRINDLYIAAIPCEVFVEIGLDIKKKEPTRKIFTISLANGYNGYLPTPQQHALGGYETWRARSSYLETDASVKILDNMHQMIEKLERDMTIIVGKAD